MNDVNAETVESEVQGNFDHQKQVVEGDAKVLWVHREASEGFEVFIFSLGKRDKIDMMATAVSL